MKKIVSIFLSIIITLTFAVDCFALQPSNNVNPTVDVSEFPFRFWTVEMLRKVGLIYDPSQIYPERPSNLQEWANQINAVDDNVNVSDEQSIKNWFQDNSVVTQDSNNNYVVNINNNYKTVLQNIGNQLINEAGFTYAYSFDFDKMSPSQFEDAYTYTSLANWINDNQNNYKYVAWIVSQNAGYILTYGCKDYQAEFVKSSAGGNRIVVTGYNRMEWTTIPWSSVEVFQYDSTTHDFNLTTSNPWNRGNQVTIDTNDYPRIYL